MSRQNASSNPPPSTEIDFTIQNHGTVFVVRCEHDRAKEFLGQSVEPDAQWFGDALAVEARFIGGLVASLREDGWRVR